MLAGAAYLRSAAFAARFGVNAGRWLVVTTSAKRLEHLMQVTAQAAPEDASLFYFATLDDLSGVNPLSDPLWRQARHGLRLGLMTGM